MGTHSMNLKINLYNNENAFNVRKNQLVQQ